MASLRTDRLSGKVGLNFTERQAVVDDNVDAPAMVSAVMQIAAERSEEAILLRDKGLVEEAQATLQANSIFLQENAAVLDSDELAGYETSSMNAMRKDRETFPSNPHDFVAGRLWTLMEGETTYTNASGRWFSPAYYGVPGTLLQTGEDAIARGAPLTMQQAIDTFANRGTPITPAKIECNSTHIDTLGTRPRELGCIQATHNIVGGNQGNPDNLRHIAGISAPAPVKYDPRMGDIYEPILGILHGGAQVGVHPARSKDNPRWFSYTTSGVIGEGFSRDVGGAFVVQLNPNWLVRAGMSESVLTAYIKTSVDKSVMVVEAWPQEEILDGRPTWVVFHM